MSGTRRHRNNNNNDSKNDDNKTDEPTAPSKMKMPVDRCVALMLSAMQRNRQHQQQSQSLLPLLLQPLQFQEVWIALQPSLAALYMQQWFPGLQQRILGIVGPNPRHVRRDPHMKWQTLVHLIRSRLQYQALAAGGGAGRGRGRGRGGVGRGAGALGRGRGAGRGDPAPGRVPVVQRYV
jgi:hypothetical protein